MKNFADEAENSFLHDGLQSQTPRNNYFYKYKSDNYN